MGSTGRSTTGSIVRHAPGLTTTTLRHSESDQTRRVARDDNARKRRKRRRHCLLLSARPRAAVPAHPGPTQCGAERAARQAVFHVQARCPFAARSAGAPSVPGRAPALARAAAAAPTLTACAAQVARLGWKEHGCEQSDFRGAALTCDAVRSRWLHTRLRGGPPTQPRGQRARLRHRLVRPQARRGARRRSWPVQLRATGSLHHHGGAVARPQPAFAGEDDRDGAALRPRARRRPGRQRSRGAAEGCSACLRCFEAV